MNNDELVKIGINLTWIKGLSEKIIAYIKYDGEPEFETKMAERVNGVWVFNPEFQAIEQSLSPKDLNEMGMVLANTILDMLQDAVKDKMLEDFNKLNIEEYEAIFKDKAKAAYYKIEAQTFQNKLQQFSIRWAFIGLCETEGFQLWIKDLMDIIEDKMAYNDEITNS